MSISISRSLRRILVAATALAALAAAPSVASARPHGQPNPDGRDGREHRGARDGRGAVPRAWPYRGVPHRAQRVLPPSRVGRTHAPRAVRPWAHVAPPVRRHEVRPRHLRGHVWTPGYWAWSGANYAWVDGRWVQPPAPRQEWVEPQWVAQDGGWALVPGYWQAY